MGQKAAIPVYRPTLSVEKLGREGSRTDFELSWTPVSGAQGYNLYIMTTGWMEREWEPTNVGLVTSANHNEVGGPNAITTAYYKVSAYTSSGEGPTSNTVSITVQ